MKLYKLTDKNGYTRPGMSNACLWGPNVSHSGTGQGELCGPGYIHAYIHPLLAVFMNPIHADFTSPKLWLAEGDIVKREGDLKVGCRSLITIREITLPVMTCEQRACFAILTAMEVYKDPSYKKWAENYLSGKDRSARSAAECARSAEAAETARSAWTAWCAAECARSARSAAYCARLAAETARLAAETARSAEPKSFLVKCAEKAYLA